MTATSPQPDTRAAYTAGLRTLADLLDENPDVPLPYSGSEHNGIMWILQTAEVDQRAVLQTFARLLPGPVEKGYRATDFDLKGTLEGLHLHVIADRNTVCERVVTGTREVTREVPDPEALAAVPTTVVTETVEDVEWICAPLLQATPVPA